MAYVAWELKLLLIYRWFLVNYLNKSIGYDTWDAHENDKTGHLEKEESHKRPHLERERTYERFLYQQTSYYLCEGQN